MSVAVLTGLPGEGSTPQPRHERHPPEPHQEGAFSSRPGGGKSILERKRLATERCDVKQRGVVDEKQVGEGDEREHSCDVQHRGKQRTVFVKTRLKKQPRNSDEGHPHRQPPHGAGGLGDPHGLCSFPVSRADLPAEEFRPRIAKGEQDRNHALGQQKRPSYEDFQSDNRLVQRTHVAQFIG